MITGDSGDVNVGTGDSVTLWVTATDNIGVSSAKVSIDGGALVDMTWNAGLSRWEYVFTAPLYNDDDSLYVITVYDAALNEASSSTRGISVFDNKPPVITEVTAIPSSQLIEGYVNITATVTDNINLLEKRVIITGPTGFSDKNESMLNAGGDTYYYNVSYDIAGIYQYHIWAKDTSNNQVVSTTYQFDIYSELIITTVIPGWNFVSVPFNQTITKTNLRVRYGINEYNWSEAVNEGIILSTIYDWNRTMQGYNLTDILNPGEGYWIYAYSECEIWATELGPMVTDGYITSLKHKWNIIGAPINQPINKTSLLVTYYGEDYNWTQATTSENPTGSPLILGFIYDWNRQINGYQLSDYLNPGYAYWMYAYQTCILKQ